MNYGLQKNYVKIIIAILYDMEFHDNLMRHCIYKLEDELRSVENKLPPELMGGARRSDGKKDDPHLAASNLARMKNSLIKRELRIESLKQTISELIGRRLDAAAHMYAFYDSAGIDDRFRKFTLIWHMNNCLRLGRSTEHSDAVELFSILEQRYASKGAAYSEYDSVADFLCDTPDISRMSTECDRLVSDDMSDGFASLERYTDERIKKELEYERFMCVLCQKTAGCD